LPERVTLRGVAGATRLIQAGNDPILTGKGTRYLDMSGIILDGLSIGGIARRMEEDRALMQVQGVERLLLTRNFIHNSGGYGLWIEACAGHIDQNHISGIAEAGIRTLDSKGLSITDNTLENCGNNGIQVWRTIKTEDGTIVRGNRIRQIRAMRGGTGQYGNAINVFRAGGCTITGNHIRDCAFTAVRVNGATNSIISQNNCANFGEVGIFAEFEFDGAVVGGNIIDGAVSGIQIVNFTPHKGQLATCSGNIVRNLRASPIFREAHFGYGVGIKTEAGCVVTGNIVENVPHMGIEAGFGASLQDVIVSNNTIRHVPIGIGASVTAGAGFAQITQNLVSKTSKGAIVGMDHNKIVIADLTANKDPRSAHLKVEGNFVR
jgi:uncharacterized secreted repeat protein (TIGR03808 family)